MIKPTIAVVFGSRSTEHDVSIITALVAIIKPLELSQKFEVVPVYIAKDGRWFSDPGLKNVVLYRSGQLETFLAKLRPLSVQFDQGLKLVQNKGFKTRIQNIDVVFPALHGTHGEDGELMGLCELADVPYVGCDVPSSVVAMDKVLAKQVAAAHGVPTAKFVAFTKTEFAAQPKTWVKQINDDLKYPLFVKPAHLGSSIGITRVTNKQDLANAIEVALHYDTKALVEEAVLSLIEVTLPVMGNEELTPAYLERPLLSTEDFFDFETKYMGNGGKQSGGGKGGKQGAQGYSQLPAELPKALYKQAEQTGLDVYRALGCTGTARVDMLINTKANVVYFNEVNPLPGSLYAHNWQRKGVSNVELVTRLVELAQERWQAKKQLETTFSTSFLQQF